MAHHPGRPQGSPAERRRKPHRPPRCGHPQQETTSLAAGLHFYTTTRAYTNPPENCRPMGGIREPRSTLDHSSAHYGFRAGLPWDGKIGKMTCSWGDAGEKCCGRDEEQWESIPKRCRKLAANGMGNDHVKTSDRQEDSVCKRNHPQQNDTENKNKNKTETRHMKETRQNKTQQSKSKRSKTTQDNKTTKTHTQRQGNKPNKTKLMIYSDHAPPYTVQCGSHPAVLTQVVADTSLQASVAGLSAEAFGGRHSSILVALHALREAVLWHANRYKTLPPSLWL